MDNLQEKNEQTVNEQATAGTEAKNDEKKTDDINWLDKLEGIISKRADGLAKSILKDNGLQDDEIKDILKQYHDNKAKKTETAKNEAETLRGRVTELEGKLFNEKLTKKADSIADELGINKKYVSQVLKLADLSKTNNGGELEEIELKTAMQKVIDDCDAFTVKTDDSRLSFGAAPSKEEADAGMEKIRKIMGLK